MIRQVDDDIRQLLNKITQQAAILANQIDMLKIHHSLALVRLSLLKVPSKLPPLNTSPIPPPISTAVAPSITADTSLSSPPSTTTTTTTAPPLTSVTVAPPPASTADATPTPLSTAVPDSTTPLSSSNFSNFHSTLLSSTTASSPTPTRIESPISRVLTLPTDNLQIDSSKPRSPLLFISSRHNPPRPSIIQSLGPALQPGPFPSMPPSFVLSSFTTNTQPFILKIEFVTITVDNETLSSNFTCLFLLKCFECKRMICEGNVFIFDPGGEIELECFLVACLNGDVQLNHNPDLTNPIPLPPTFDLEDKVVFKRSGMIRLIHMHQLGFLAIKQQQMDKNRRSTFSAVADKAEPYNQFSTFYIFAVSSNFSFSLFS